jgi:uncharacterized membrane protein
MVYDISIIEFGVYAFLAYSGMLMLIISTIREAPQTKSQSFTRAMYLIPSIVCAFLLAGMGETIGIQDMYHEEIHPNNTVTTSHEEYRIQLMNPVWITVNFMIAIIMLFHFIMQTLQLLLFRD